MARIESKNMDESYRLSQEIQALRDRMTKLCAATLRINESLDFDTVLQGVLDSARSLTNARYGVMTLLDDYGGIQDSLSSGMTAEETKQLWNLAGGMRLFGYLRSIAEPLRLPDLLSHVRCMGLPELRPPMEVSPAVSFLASPVLHRAERVGNVYLAEKEGGGEFTREDEETLVLFASQAALVISNARTHREERRARTYMETLIETCPVGVAVLNAKTGEPVSFNREAARMVSGLLDQDQPAEELLRLVTIKRADGSEFSLQELSLAQALSAVETVRAEEVVIKLSDGRSVTALMNATPILSTQGQVESFVITMQDMTALEELDRQRAEFLGMVSHELRAPLSSIKGSATTLKESANTLDPAEMELFFRIIEQQSDHMSSLITDLLNLARIDTGALSVAPEATEAAGLVDQARNSFLSGADRNNIHIDLEPDLPLVMADRRRIVQVLINLLSNAAKHSPESSPIQMAVTWEAMHVAFSVTDHGRGLSPDLLPTLFRKFSRIDGDDRGQNLEGSGLELAICKGIVEAHGGRIWAESGDPGLGARFTFTLPMATQADYVAMARPPRPNGRFHRAGRERTRVLVVDDDPQTLRFVRDTLSNAGYESMVTGNPEQVSSLIKKEKPHLVLLDLILPGVDGIELMESVPELGEAPVIFLSAYGRDQIIARALQAGAVDYIVKPFSPTELVARIQTALRRQHTAVWTAPSEPYRFGALTINYTERIVSLAGRAIRLTDREYRLLYELSVNAGRLLTHNQLLQRVWGPGQLGHSGPIRTVVKNLRRKLSDYANNPRYILTEPRVGYRMPKSEEQEDATSD